MDKISISSFSASFRTDPSFQSIFTFKFLFLLCPSLQTKTSFINLKLFKGFLLILNRSEQSVCPSVRLISNLSILSPWWTFSFQTTLLLPSLFNGVWA